VFSFGKPKAADGEEKPKIGFCFLRPAMEGIQESSTKPISFERASSCQHPPRGEGGSAILVHWSVAIESRSLSMALLAKKPETIECETFSWQMSFSSEVLTS
jgi:hypothetical protein